MAITIVGTVQISAGGNGTDRTLTFDGTPTQDDVVILIGGNAQDDGNEPMGPNTLGYTEIWLDNGDGTNERGMGAWYKVLGASPDATVVCEGGGDAQDGVGYASYVLRGVDTSNPMDATRTLAGPTASTNPDPAAIDTATAGAWVIIGASSGAAESAVNVPANYENEAFAQGVDTNQYGLAVATREIASPGTENPANWTGWASGTWKTVTIAVRPASEGPNEGAATGAISWAGSATGTNVHSGSASGSISWAGSSTGTTTRSGSASGAITWAGTADGEAPVVVQEGEGIGSITWAGTAAGTTTRSGASTGSIIWAGTASGIAVHNGAATGTITWAGSSTGETDFSGASTGTITWAGSANGSAPGVGPQEGTAAGSITWAGTATGQATHAGASGGTIIWVGAATGAVVHQGSADGSITWSGTAAGQHTEHTFWQPDPVAYTPAGVAYTPAPVAYSLASVGYTPAPRPFTPMDPEG